MSTAKHRCLHCHRPIAAANLVQAPPAGFAHRACEVKYGKPALTILPQTEQQKAMTRCAIGEASDNDRVSLACKGMTGRMIGPDECQPCDKHPGQFAVYRWVWDVPEDGDHARAIESSDPDLVRDCPKCAEEDDAKWREEIGDDGT